MTNSFVTKILKYLLSILLTIIIIYFLFKHQDPIALVNELAIICRKLNIDPIIRFTVYEIRIFYKNISRMYRYLP